MLTNAVYLQQKYKLKLSVCLIYSDVPRPTPATDIKKHKENAFLLFTTLYDALMMLH